MALRRACARLATNAVGQAPRAVRVRSVSDGLRVTDWTSVGDALVATGSVHIRGALDGGLVEQLVNATRPPWQALSPGEGPVRQSGFGSYTSVAETQPFVGDVGTDIVRELTTVCPDVPAIPDFNEVN